MKQRVPYRGVWPTIHESAWLAPNCAVIGDVHVGAESTVWFSTTIRGDVAPIRIGERTSIQDNAVVHATSGWTETHIGDACTIGHSAILHGCSLGDRVLIGMGAIVLDAAEIGSDSMVGAGSLVTSRKKFPSGVLILGRPAKVVRELTDEEREGLQASVHHYDELKRHYEAEGI